VSLNDAWSPSHGLVSIACGFSFEPLLTKITRREAASDFGKGMKGLNKLYEASKKANPQVYLMEQLKELKKEDITELLSEIRGVVDVELSPLHPQCAVLEDVKNYMADDSNASMEVLMFKYAYFATCMSHVWLPMSKFNPIACYAKPNESCPYLWFHATENRECVLIKHTIADLNEPFKVVLLTPNHPKQKWAYDLQHNTAIRSCKGSYLEMLLDTEQKRFKVTGACNFGNFMVVLSFGFRFEYCGMYYNAKDTRTIWPMSAFVHSVAAGRKKSIN
jgi:hypothetical protein